MEIQDIMHLVVVQELVVLKVLVDLAVLITMVAVHLGLQAQLEHLVLVVKEEMTECHILNIITLQQAVAVDITAVAEEHLEVMMDVETVAVAVDQHM
jgi:hypothetical protein